MSQPNRPKTTTDPEIAAAIEAIWATAKDPSAEYIRFADLDPAKLSALLRPSAIDTP
jgi:hypothetical protein